MSRVTRLPYAFSLALLAALAAGCGSAAPAGERISAVPAGFPDQASSLQQGFVSIVRAVSPAVVFDARGDVVTNAHAVENATRFVARSPRATVTRQRSWAETPEPIWR
jgi:S1-C subfamily serine protease